MGLKESGLRGSLRSTSSVLPAFFDVTITNTNSPVQEGDILTVDYSADNTGDAQDTQDIRLEIDSVEEDRDSDITLLGAQSTTGTLEWDTTDEDETTYTATVLSNDDTDSVTVEIESAIPDSGLLHDWEASNFDGSTWTDQEGAVDLTSNGSVSLNSGGFNGKDAVEFSGGNFTGSLSQSTPLVWFAVVDLTDDGNIQGLFGDDDDDGDPAALYRYDSNDAYRLRSGGDNFEAGPVQAGQQINAFEINGADSQVRTNASQVGTGTLSAGSFDGNLLIGEQVGFPDRVLNGLVARMLVYDRSQMASGQIGDVEDHLNVIYGVY